jgi:hypothetical protein
MELVYVVTHYSSGIIMAVHSSYEGALKDTQDGEDHTSEFRSDYNSEQDYWTVLINGVPKYRIMSYEVVIKP